MCCCRLACVIAFSGSVYGQVYTQDLDFGDRSPCLVNVDLFKLLKWTRLSYITYIT